MVTGLLGTGKSTTARNIKDKLGVPVTGPEEMRREMGIQTYDASDTPRVMGAIGELMGSTIRGGNSITLATPYVREAARRESYDHLLKLDKELGRKVSGVLIRCECPEDISRNRIVQRGGYSLPPFNPDAYDRVRRQFEEITEAEIARNTHITYIFFDTDNNEIRRQVVRDDHEAATSSLLAAILREIY